MYVKYKRHLLWRFAGEKKRKADRGRHSDLGQSLLSSSSLTLRGLPMITNNDPHKRCNDSSDRIMIYRGLTPRTNVCGLMCLPGQAVANQRSLERPFIKSRRGCHSKLGIIREWWCVTHVSINASHCTIAILCGLCWHHGKTKCTCFQERFLKSIEKKESEMHSEGSLIWSGTGRTRKSSYRSASSYRRNPLLLVPRPNCRSQDTPMTVPLHPRPTRDPWGCDSSSLRSICITPCQEMRRRLGGWGGCHWLTCNKNWQSTKNRINWRERRAV
jgi:hypothetical protein